MGFPNSPILLVDADELLFTTLSALERECDWGGDVWTLTVNKAEAVAALLRRFQGYVDAFSPSDVILAFTGPGVNFRKALAPFYKAHRVKTRKPMLYAQLREEILEGALLGGECKPVLRPTLEADDTCGILATKPTNAGRTIIVSQDKDLKTIPGHLFRGEWDGGGAPVVYSISEAEANRSHLVQALMGDTADGYKGCPGIGEETAADLLDKGLKLVRTEKVITRGKRQGQTDVAWERAAAETPWETVVSCFAKAGLTEEDALLQARLARILRWSDWDGKNQEVKLWEPA